MLTWIISDFFKALIDNQLLHSVLKDFISVFTEMYLNGVSGIPQLPFETVGLLLVFGFCHISLLYIKIERIDWFLYALTLCYLFCFDCGNSCLDKLEFLCQTKRFNLTYYKQQSYNLQ